jgi:hypothetical protein
MQGFAVTGQQCGATLIGKAKARNFAQACHIVMCKHFLNYNNKINKPNFKGHTQPGRWDYNPNDLSEWGCGLYWSEELARKSFG